MLGVYAKLFGALPNGPDIFKPSRTALTKNKPIGKPNAARAFVFAGLNLRREYRGRLVYPTFPNPMTVFAAIKTQFEMVSPTFAVLVFK